MKNVEIASIEYGDIDLTSSSSLSDALDATLDGILDGISDKLRESNVLTWAGSLVGLVEPRDDLQAEWQVNQNMRIDLLGLVQNPIVEITKYYTRLFDTDVDWYGTGNADNNVVAWLFVQEALVKLLETALAVPLGIPTPSMPSGQSDFYTGDGSTSILTRLP